MKSSLAAVKRQRFPARASPGVLGLFILGLGQSVILKSQVCRLCNYGGSTVIYGLSVI